MRAYLRAQGALLLSGKLEELGAPPALIDAGKPMVPVRSVADWAAIRTTLNQPKKQLILATPSHCFTLPLSGTSADFDGQPWTLAAQLLTRNGVIYIPASDLGKAFGLTIKTKANLTTFSAFGRTTSLFTIPYAGLKDAEAAWVSFRSCIQREDYTHLGNYFCRKGTISLITTIWQSQDGSPKERKLTHVQLTRELNKKGSETRDFLNLSFDADHFERPALGEWILVMMPDEPDWQHSRVIFVQEDGVWRVRSLTICVSAD